MQKIKTFDGGQRIQGAPMRSPHNKFSPVREVERVTWRDYALALGFALALLGLCALYI